MASAIICLANNQKFNFSKYIFDNLKKNLEAGVPFYMFPRFVQVFLNHQIGDLSHHTSIYVNPSLTKKVFANIKRIGTRFSGIVTPLFVTMMVQPFKEVGDLPTADQDIPIPNAPSSSQPQRKHKPRRKDKKKTEVSPTELPIEENVPTPSSDPLPSGEDSMPLKEFMVLCTNLSNKVLDMENKVIEMKSSHKAKITELESKVEKLEEEIKSLTKELTRVEIADIDADAEVNLENVYNLDLAHEETVLSMHDATDADGKEIVEVITTAKLIVDEVSTAGGEEPSSAAPTNITTAQPSQATRTIVDISNAPKAKGIVFYDVEKSTTRTASSKAHVKDKGKAKFVKDPKVLKSRKSQIVIDKEVARRIEAEWNANMQDNIDWNEVVEQEGPKMDAENIKALRKEEVEKDQTVKKQKGDELEKENAEKQNLVEQQEAEELKRNLEIVPDDEDVVFVNVAPLSSKPPKIMDYKI
uniref:Synaptobrevin, longin-like domain protein n=1 Tax=Tanacetum cinerariifolium TaxID=118510 RepID=A0A6L2LYX6_TANCI|nr:hypothetical protein [Tanacetum cinerariifolium]